MGNQPEFYNALGSGYLQSTLREPLRGYLPNEQNYLECFDRFEYLIGLGEAMLRKDDEKGGWVAPVGCFGWRGRRKNREHRTWIPIQQEFEAQQENWPPLKSGFLAGSKEEVSTAMEKYNTFLNNFTSRGH